MRVWQRDLVEVIDISRNEWCLVRPVVRAGEEGVEEGGWVPAGFLKPYSGGGFGECCGIGIAFCSLCGEKVTGNFMGENVREFDFHHQSKGVGYSYFPP